MVADVSQIKLIILNLNRIANLIVLIYALIYKSRMKWDYANPVEEFAGQLKYYTNWNEVISLWPSIVN